MQVKATAAQRRRLKALHWDKIRAPQAGTVWSQAAGQQLKLDFDQLESLFQVGCPALALHGPRNASLLGPAYAEKRVGSHACMLRWKGCLCGTALVLAALAAWSPWSVTKSAQMQSKANYPAL